MIEELKQFLTDESGPDLIEWVVVTVILILAVYAILQALGPEIDKALGTVGLGSGD